MKKSIQIIATVLVMLFSNSAFGQNDTMYVMRNGVVTHTISLDSNHVDSIIFYNPNPIDTTTNSTITDADGNVYTSVTIGTQEWMVENLRTKKYSDGTSIPNITGNTEWAKDTIGAWCNYNNDSQYDSTYGKLYNWYAVGTSKLCPTGWHVPTDLEWTLLTDYLAADGHSGAEGTALKATSGWNNNGNGTDDYGWNGLPSGSRVSDGSFNYFGYINPLWSSSEYDTSYVWGRHLNHTKVSVSRGQINKTKGRPVRCLRDNESTQTTSQVRLENGETPLDIYQSGVPIDSIVGKTYQGGLIAYLDILDGTGLIAAPTDQRYAPWGCEGTLISGADGTKIGTGEQNTADILAGCSETNIAAYLCDTLKLGGYNDWFLPSKDELNKLYENIGQGNALGLGNVGGFADNRYWSSSQFNASSASYAWSQNLYSGSQGYNDKSRSSGYFRAVRAF